MRNPAPLVALFVLVAGCASDPADGTAPSPSPEPSVSFQPLATRQVNEGGIGFEPSIEVAADGTIYVSAARGLDLTAGAEAVRSSRLWVSGDGGATFREIAPIDPATGASNLPYGMEGDLAVNQKGHAYFVELTLVGVTLSRSTDQGATWQLRNPDVFPLPWGDREWVAAGPGDTVAVTWINLLLPFGPDAIPRLWVAVSQDGGLTFPVQTPIPEAGESGASGIDMAPDGTLIVASDVGGAVAYVSRDGGATFQQSVAHATENPTDYTFVSAAADAGNNLYLAWAELSDGNAAVYYSASSDHGETWTGPFLVSDAGGAAALPWLDAGEAGHLAVAYYGAPGHPGDPNEVEGPWFPFVTDVRDAASSAPRMLTTAMAEQPVSHVAMCNKGNMACGGTPDLGDYLQVAIGPDGRDHVAWADQERNIFWGVAGTGWEASGA